MNIETRQHPTSFAATTVSCAENISVMALGEVAFLRGCNIHHARSVIRQKVYFSPSLKDWVAAPDFEALFEKRFRQLNSFAPTLGRRVPISRHPDSNSKRAIDIVLLEAILCIEAAVFLAARNFEPVRFAQVVSFDETVDLIWECSTPKLSRRAAEVAFLGVLELFSQEDDHSQVNGGSSFDVSLSDLLHQARQTRLSQTASLMKFVASRRDLPVTVVGHDRLRIGWGKAQQLMLSSMTEKTSAIGQRLALNKRDANRHLAEVCIPVPRQIKVNSLEGAYRAAEKLGFPVVIKPLRGRGGYGIVNSITSKEEIEAAVGYAMEHGSHVVVEEFVVGRDYRLLVVGGEFVAAVQRHPPTVVGDGKKTIRELIDDLNSDTFRDGLTMNRLTLDWEMERTLKFHGMTLDSVPAQGQNCPLRLVANLALGAMAIDCTDFVHSDNRELAERATKAFGLDVAGVDVVTSDISASYKDTGAQVIEINARPGLLMHMWPRHGKSRDVAGKVFDTLFPADVTGHVPTIVVAGDRGTGTVARVVEKLLAICGRYTALSLRETAYLNGTAVTRGANQTRVSPMSLLRDPKVETLISAISLRRIARHGLVLDQCAVSVILDRNKDGNAVHFHRGMSVLDRATTDVFVVGCGNQLAPMHLNDAPMRRHVFVGRRLTDPLVQQYVSDGSTVVADAWLDDTDCIVVCEGAQELARFPSVGGLDLLSNRQQAKARQAIKYAVAAAFGVGLPVSDIGEALASDFGRVFTKEAEANPA